MDEMVKEYIEKYSQGKAEVLSWLEKQTHLRTNHSRMLTGHTSGCFLELISKMIKPKRILELGCFTGYSAICLSRGLDVDGRLDTLEIDDELEDLIREGFKREGASDKICLYIGDAKDILANLDEVYDLVYIDANKREYVDYYKLIFDKVGLGGYIIADNVLWDGKVAKAPIPTDAQTQSIHAFNELVKNDIRVENIILPLRDGVNLIRKISL